MLISLDDLKQLLNYARGASYTELRFHARSQTEIRIAKAELEEAKTVVYDGVGIRALVNGAWGFSSSDRLGAAELRRALADAIAIARVSSTAKKEKVTQLAPAHLMKGRFEPPITDPLTNHSLEEKVRLVKDTEANTRNHSPAIKSATCTYREILDHKLIVTSDGAEVELVDSKPEFRVSAVASRNGELVNALEAVGVTGGWKELFQKADADELSRRAAATAVKLLEAKQPKGERTTVILDPGMVGLISHEAIGHTVEADFVLSGSIVKGKLGEKVASDLVTLVDSGPSMLAPGAGGSILVDDEGVQAARTPIIERGVLRSYLHNRETAALFGVPSTGNARAFEYSDEPLIRMRNTYIEPGDWSLDEMVKETRHGYLVKGPRNGQADANGEFMFGAQEAYRIEQGEIRELLRGVSISGRALDVLRTVDAVARDFTYDLGSGFCGKWQAMKVDGGGAHLRCEAIIGGVQ